MARLLVMDDDPQVLDMIAMLLEDEGHEVIGCPDGKQGLEAHTKSPFDGIVSDVNMPIVDGFSFCRTLREADDATPILLLTARDSEIDEALGLDLGADDYLIKPIRSRVLTARVRAILRRRQASAPSESLLQRDQVSLDSERLELRFHETLIPTTVTEFRLIRALIERPGIVFSREHLLREARQDDSVVVPRLVDTYIRRLRKKLTALDPDFDRIETVIGAGYRWCE